MYTKQFLNWNMHMCMIRVLSLLHRIRFVHMKTNVWYIDNES